MAQKKDITEQVEDNTTSIALLGKDISYMKTGIDSIINSVKSLREDVSNGFAKKEEIESLKTRISTLENLKDWGIKIVVGAIIISLLSLVLIKTQ